jgi:hypothetical protein
MYLILAHRINAQLPNQKLQTLVHPEGITSARNLPKSGEGAFQTGSWNRVPTDQVEQLEQLNQAIPERQGLAWRIFDGAIKRILALLAISWFGYEKHYQWVASVVHPRKMGTASVSWAALFPR